MTKEELRKEATSTIEWECTPMIDRPLFVHAYITGAEPREERITELKNENELLKNRTKDFENQILGLLIKYENVYERFPDLKESRDKAEFILKENAELKETVTKMNNVITETFSNLTKAKEIIEELLDTQSCLDPYKDIFKDRVLKAEQFLKED